MSTATAQPRVKFRNIALPASHGGWGFLLEPVILGLWLAPSAAGFWLSIAALGAFLAQQPLKLAVTDRQKGRRYPRSVWAERIALLYGLLAIAAFALALISAQHLFLLPLLLAAPLALVQLYFDAQNRGRELVPELFGAVALGAVAPAIMFASGWAVGYALAVWVILSTRSLVSIVYVRTRLRLERGVDVTIAPVWGIHLLGVVVITALWLANLAPWLAILALVILFIRAAVGLSPYRKPVQPKNVGFQETGYGLLTIILTGAGYSVGL